MGIAAGCDNASWEVFDNGCNLQVARGKVKKGRCESIASCKSGRVLYLGWDNPEAGYLLMADTYTPGNMKKIDVDGPTDMTKSICLAPDGTGLATASFDGDVRIFSMMAD